MGVGPKIKELRNKAGLTQKDLADQLHVTYQAVSRWENDDAEPSIGTLKEMCGILNCSIDELFEIEKKDEQKPVEEKKKAEQRQREKEANFRKRRIHSFIWPSLVALIFIISGISTFAKGDASTGFGCLGVGVLAYCFIATMILNNTFITDMWLEITSWGFVKLPGIIFEFSFDGLIFLIAMKILFFILGIILALLAATFASLLAMALSIFVYPFALRKNLKGEE